MERLKITGIDYKDDQVRFGLGPKKQSSLFDLGDNVLLFRSVGETIFTKEGKSLRLNSTVQIKRRIDAYKLNKKTLPSYTAVNNFVVLQGAGIEDEVEKKFPVLGRLTKKLENVKSITEFRDIEIIRSLSVCRAIIDINKASFRTLLMEGVIMETGGHGRFGEDWTGPFYRFVRRLTHDNVMVGYTKSGQEKIFVDPDWYVVPGEEGQNSLVQKVKRYGILGARIIAFEALIFIQKFLFRHERGRSSEYLENVKTPNHF